MEDHNKPQHPQLQPFTVEAEACTAVLLACLRANELDNMAENAVFIAAINSRNIFKGHNYLDLLNKAAQMADIAISHTDLIDNAVGAIREQTRLPLFYHCLDVILADGIVTPLENNVLQYLKGKFRIPDEVVFRAIDVLVIKNQL